MPTLGPDSTFVMAPAPDTTDNTRHADAQPIFPTDLQESMNSRTAPGSNTPGELPAFTLPPPGNNNPELEAALLQLAPVPTSENVLANLGVGVRRWELLRRQRMEMQARYNSF